MSVFSERLLSSIRSYQYHRSRSGAWHRLMRKIARIRHALWSILTQSDIAPEARLGENLRLPHPNGVVIHGEAVVGNGCLIMQQVTIGMILDGQVPEIGDNVYVGAGAKIIGKIRVGDGARIGANAVVTQDVPPDCTAVGVPARLIASKGDQPAG